MNWVLKNIARFIFTGNIPVGKKMQKILSIVRANFELPVKHCSGPHPNGQCVIGLFGFDVKLFAMSKKSDSLTVYLTIV